MPEVGEEHSGQREQHEQSPNGNTLGSFEESKEASVAGTQGLSQSAWAAITKHHRLSGLNSRNLFSYSSRLKTKIKVPLGLVSGETSLLGLQMAGFSLCLHGACSLCVRREGVQVSVSLLVRASVLLDWSPTL